MPGWRTSTVWLIGCLTVALTLRLIAIVVVDGIVSQTPGRLCLIEGDAEGYWLLGQKLARGEAYSLYEPPRRILRMPGFPLLLAASQLVFGDHVFPVRCLLAIIGTLGCGCVYVLGRDLADPAVGLWACAAVSLSPPLVAFTPLLLTETAFATALVASLIPVVRLLRQPAPGIESGPPAAGQTLGSARIGLSICAGAAITVATYIRPTWLPMAGVAALGILVAGRFRPVRWIEAGVLLLSCAVFLAPWTYRNYLVCGHVVPTTLWVGPSLYDGLNQAATGDSDMTFFDQENLLASMSEYDMDCEYRRRAWAFVAAEPARVLQLAFIKAGRYWSPWPNAAQFNRPWLKAGLIAATLPLYFGALAGLWFRRRDWVFCLCTLGPALFFCLVHMLFVGSIRYRLPADYVLWIAAASGFLEMLRRWRPLRDGGVSTWVD